MDNELPFQAEFQSESTMDGHDTSHDQFTGAFFPQSQNLTVTGGQFRSITNVHHVVPTVPSDFRRIPIGDLDLRNEIRLDGESGVAYRTYGQFTTRRMYSARIYGSKSPMTVALYQGENTEEEWHRDLSQYSWLRHPNIVQLFGTASSAGMHATIFHDELILVKQAMEKYRGSHLAAVYLWAYFETELRGAKKYMDAVSGKYLYPWECTIWIRASTGRLCVDCAPPEHPGPFNLWVVSGFLDSPPSFIRLGLEPPEDSKLIDLISLDTYHPICLHHFQHGREVSVSTNASVHLGSLIYCPHGSDIDSSKEIAYIPDLNVVEFGWSTLGGKGNPLLVMESGWTRVNSCDLVDGFLSCHIRCDYMPRYGWLAQANHIFNRLGITSNHRDYVIVDMITCQLEIFRAGDSIPCGYLFLCPFADLRSDDPSYFRHPECAAYWSLDPSGDERLGMEAEQLGFPAFEFMMNVHAFSWDESVYAGIHKFHQAKGFDPDSLDVARELGRRLFEVSTEVDGPFAHFEEVEDCGGDSGHYKVSDETPSEVLKFKSGAVSFSEAVHKESDLDSHLVLEASYNFDDIEVAEPCRTWRIVMSVQFALILTTTILWLHDLLRSHNLTNS